MHLLLIGLKKYPYNSFNVISQATYKIKAL